MQTVTIILTPLAYVQALEVYLERFVVFPNVIVRGALLIPVKTFILNELLLSVLMESCQAKSRYGVSREKAAIARFENVLERVPLR